LRPIKERLKSFLKGNNKTLLARINHQDNKFERIVYFKEVPSE